MRIEAYTDSECELLSNEMSCPCVYMFYNRLSGLTKIGITQNLYKRKRTLERSSGTRLELIYLKYHDTANELERLLHRHYAKYRQEGEFFSLPDSVLNVIRGEL